MRDARFLKCFTAGGLFRLFIIFAAASDPLPDGFFSTLEK